MPQRSRIWRTSSYKKVRRWSQSSWPTVS